MKFSAIITDLDGTLYDKSGLAVRIVFGELMHLPLLVAERRTRKRLSGQYFGSAEAFYEAFFRDMAQRHIFSEARARKWYFRHYMPLMTQLLRNHYHPTHWAMQMLREAKATGTPVVVYSDYDFVEQKLLALGFYLSDFTFVVSAPQLGGLKPCKEAAQKIIERLNVKPEEVLFYGDRDDTDGATARALNSQIVLL